MVRDPYTQENLERDEYPAFIAQGSILKADFREINAFNEEREYAELLLVVQVVHASFLLVSFVTGNRWLSAQIQGESNGTVSSRAVLDLLKKTPNTELKHLRLIGHINEIDLFSFLAGE